MERLPSRRVLVYLAFGCLVLVGGVWGLTTSGGSAGASEVLLVQDQPADGTAITAGPDSGAAGPVGSASGPAEPGQTPTPEAEVYVQVAGSVREPGVYRVPPGSRVYEVLQRAGGVTAEADEQALTLAAPVSDGARIYVPKRGESVPATGSGAVTGGSSPSGGGGPEAAAPVSLNAATQTQLEELPGIGPATAGRIIAHREQDGPFQSVDELDDVPGIGPALMERLRPLVVP